MDTAQSDALSGGTFIGLGYGVSFLGCLNQLILRAIEHNLPGFFHFVALAALNGVNCLLLLRRKRIAVSVFIRTNAVTFVSPFVGALIAREPPTTRDMAIILPFVFLFPFFALIFGWYLWRRRELLAA
jgi:hypothetical protein